MFAAPRRFFPREMPSSPPPLFVPVISAATHGRVHGFSEANKISRMIRRRSAVESVRGRVGVGGVEFSCRLPPGVPERQVIFVFRRCLVLLDVCYFNLIRATA